MNRPLRSVPTRQPEPLRYAIGAAALENDARAVYQSARCKDGARAELPYTEAQAWAWVEREGVA